jgi:tetratricopeptide (TPR) repeat protein
MLPSVQALVIRAGSRPEDLLEVWFAQARILAQRARFSEAIELYEKIVALGDSGSALWRLPGAIARSELGEIFLQLEDYPEAMRRMQGALQVVQSIFGDHHPRVLMARANLALAESKVDSDAAFATVAEMRALAATLPADEWRVITIPFLEGQIREDRGDCAHALPFYREALALFSARYGPLSHEAADVWARLGAFLAALGQRGAALLELERALTTRRTIGDAPNVVARAAYELARTLASPGATPADHARALELAEEARSLWQQDGVSGKVKDVEQWLGAAQPTSAQLPPARAAKQATALAAQRPR